MRGMWMRSMDGEGRGRSAGGKGPFPGGTDIFKNHSLQSFGEIVRFGSRNVGRTGESGFNAICRASGCGLPWRMIGSRSVVLLMPRRPEAKPCQTMKRRRTRATAT